MEAIRKGTSMNKAAQDNGIPRTTVQDYCRRQTATKKTMGSPAVFGKNMESALVEHVLEREAMLYGVTRMELRRLAFEVLYR